MIATDRTALICDLAETYGIYDMQALPVPTLAALASGLRDDSRIKLKMSGAKVDLKTLLLAVAVDDLQFLKWAKTTAAQNGTNYPKSIVQALMQVETRPQNVAYASGEEFDAAWKRLSGGGGT